MKVPGCFLPYEVSNLGRIRRLDGRCADGRMWKGSLMSPSATRGHRSHIRLPVGNPPVWKCLAVHRLVAEAFIGPPPGKTGTSNDSWQINHKNGVHTDNRACNLEWVTRRQNWAHAREMGLFHKGHAHRVKLSSEDRTRLIELVASGMSQKAVAAQFGIHQCHVSRIVNNKRRSFG